MLLGSILLLVVRRVRRHIDIGLDSVAGNAPTRGHHIKRCAAESEIVLAYVGCCLSPVSQHMNWTELTRTGRPIYTKCQLIARVSVTTYFVLIGYRHCSKLGRLFLNTCIQMPNLHHPPHKTTLSCLCRVWCAGVNETIALNVFRLQIFCRRQSSVFGNIVTPPKRTRHRQDSFVVSGVAVWISFNGTVHKEFANCSLV